MAPKKYTPSEPLYVPKPRELVYDRETGRQGEFMAADLGRIYLRPAGGGIEWVTERSDVKPLDWLSRLTPAKRRALGRRQYDNGHRGIAA